MMRILRRLRPALLLLLLAAGAAGVRALQHGSAQMTPVPAVPFETDVASVRILLGLQDEQPREWDGRLTVSNGTLVRLIGWNTVERDSVAGNSWQIRSRLPAQGPGQGGQAARRQAVEVGVLAEIRGGQAADGARLEIATHRGQFAFTLAELRGGRSLKFLGGAASAERVAPHRQLTASAAEEDFPACAAGPDGSVWSAFVSYQPGTPIALEEVRRGRFDTLVTKGNGDQIRLLRFDGKAWSVPLEVTVPGLEVWRPAVAADGRGRVWTVWSQNDGEGNWDLYARVYDTNSDRFGGIRRLTRDPGPDINPVLASPELSSGVQVEEAAPCIAWQGWRGDNFDIWLARLDGNEDLLRPRRVSTSPGNDWQPAIAARSGGDVWVAWDTYDMGNYDVLTRRFSGRDLEPGPLVPVASSPRFEARPAVAADGQGRIWVAFEDAAPNWGKDYGTRWEGKSGEQFYLERRIILRCLPGERSGGEILQTRADVPAEPVNTTYPPGPRVRTSFPRLSLDGEGRLWLLYRRHPLSTGAGERWASFATSFDGERWSTPTALPRSENLLDNRPGLAPLAGRGLLAVYSGDGRTAGTQSARSNEIFSAFLALDPSTSARPDASRVTSRRVPPGRTASGLATVRPEQPRGNREAEPVHPNEVAEVRRMRDYRATAGGRTYRLLRGEFHRHTEISSHRDQDGPFEEIFRYGLDVARMDWIGPGDHDAGFGREYFWWLTQKQLEIYHRPGTFMPMFTYERSVQFPSGHRNVMFARRGIRTLPRIGTGQPLLMGTPEGGSPDVKNLYAYLKRFEGICSSHTSATNMGTDWRDNDPLVEPVVEIYQGHRQNYEEPKAPKAARDADDSIGGYQAAGYVWNAFGKGYRLGFQISSDHISSHISYAVVFVDQSSREGIVEAFRKRHSYGANDNIVLDVRCGEQMMGDEFSLAAPPRLEIRVEGTAPLARIDIVRQVDRGRPAYVYATQPRESGSKTLRLEWADRDARPGTTCMYYVRVAQDDGKMAWASPLWIQISKGE